MIDSYLLIIGAMKCGTTTLFDLLAGHPQIAAARNKEPGFFAFDDIFAKGFPWYESLFDFRPGQHAFAMEASTDYTKHPFCADVPARLIAAAPRRFKLIYIMRHPLRRIESHARHVQRTKMELGRLPASQADNSLDSGISPVSLAVSRYASQIDRYAGFHARGDVLLLSLEELSSAQQAVIPRVLDFLGLESTWRPEIVRKNIAGTHRRLHPMWNRLAGTPALNALAKAVTPKVLRSALRSKVTTKVQVNGRFELMPAEEIQILQDLKPDLTRLASRYGFVLAEEWGTRSA